MKKVLLVLVLIGGLIAIGNAVTRAGVVQQPQLTATPNSGPPGYHLTLRVTDCFVDDIDFEDDFVEFFVGGASFGEGFCGPDNGTTSVASTGPAPMNPGDYQVRAVISDGPQPLENDELPDCGSTTELPCELTASITVVEASLTAIPDSGDPGFDFDLSLDGCRTAHLAIKQLQTAENVTFVVPWLGEDGIVETTCSDGQAGATGFTAPGEPGTYDVFAILQGFGLQPASSHDELIDGVDPCASNGSAYADFEPCYVEAAITVDEPPPVTDPPVTDPPATDPPVTDPPVTDPPTTTAAPTTTIDEGAGVPAPTEPPVAELPATGTSGNTGVTALAILLLLAGGGLVVLGTRRRTSTEER